MARLMRKPFARPDEVRPFENGHTDIYELDEMVIGRMTMEPAGAGHPPAEPPAGDVGVRVTH